DESRCGAEADSQTGGVAEASRQLARCDLPGTRRRREHTRTRRFDHAAADCCADASAGRHTYSDTHTAACATCGNDGTASGHSDGRCGTDSAQACAASRATHAGALTSRRKPGATTVGHTADDCTGGGQRAAGLGLKNRVYGELRPARHTD